jgi:PGF-pre-PGF domain-containing protein
MRTTIVIVIMGMLFLNGCYEYSLPGYITGTAEPNGTAASDNLSSYTMRYLADDDTHWQSIGITIPDPTAPVSAATLGSWDTSFLPDGHYTLQLNVTDTLSQESTDYVYVNIDNLQLDEPLNESVYSLNETLWFNGTANGLEYQNYTLRYANQSQPYTWQTAGVTQSDNGIPNKTNETLATFDPSTLIPGQWYVFNLSMQNDNGFTNSILLNLSFVVRDIYEPDDESSQAHWFVMNSTEPHTFMPEYDLDWVKFNASAGSTYEISTDTEDQGTGFLSDTYVCLLDETADEIIDCDDDSGPGYLSRLLFPPSETGTYYAVAMHYSGEAGGAYNLSIAEHTRYYKGIIPMSYALPFYTYDQNPFSCGVLDYNDECTVNWNVRTRGYEGEEYDFYVIHETNRTSGEGNTTRVKIEEYPPPDVAILYPANGTSLATTTSLVQARVVTNIMSFCYVSTSPLFSYYGDGRWLNTTDYLTHTASVRTTSSQDYDLYYLCRNVYSSQPSERLHHTFDTRHVTSTNNSDPPGGGGGSATVTGAATAPIITSSAFQTAKRAFLDLVAGMTAEMDIASETIAIQRIMIPVRENISGAVSLSVASLRERPTAIQAPALHVYQYLEISSSFRQGTIGDIRISFAVDTSWLSEQNMSASDVVLYHDLGGGWVPLATEVTDTTDPAHVLFDATTPSFSFFAIGLIDRPVSGTALVVQTPDNDTTPEQQNISPETTESLPVQSTDSVYPPLTDIPKQIPVTSVIIGVVVIGVLCAGFFAYQKREMIGGLVARMKEARPMGNENASPLVEFIKKPTAPAFSFPPGDIQGVISSILALPQSTSQNRDMISLQLCDRYGPQEVQKGLGAISNLRSFIIDNKGKGHDIASIQKVLVSKGWNAELLELLIREMGL